VPQSNLDALAAAGFYGLSVGADKGGLGADRETAFRVVETLAAGCLTTTFVWLQSQGVVRLVSESESAHRDEWLGPMCTGELHAGVAIAGIRPGADALQARPDGPGWRLHGRVPWVTGWGRIDVVNVAALDPDGNVVWLLVDAQESATLRVVQQRLVAVDASGTVTVDFDGHAVPGERLVARTSYDDWRAQDAASLRGNGSLSLGVATRCAQLLGEDPTGADIATAVEETRTRLDRADVDDIPAARAAASELAWRAAGLLVVGHGARSVLRDQHAQRLAREAAFLLVFGSRPPIKAELRRLLSRR
jgi:alkylation response protein AidB-like acyl-CoA dehydrogenase